jgi:hypothetical protein
VLLLHNWLSPKAQARATDNKGWGSFAISPILRGELVASFGGYVVNKADLQKLTPDRISRSIQVAEDLYLVSGETPEPGDQINHSCNPNCGLLGSTVVVALRDISVGEEISYDYAMSDSEPYDEFKCECKSEICRGIVTGNDWKIPELQEKYQGFFSVYLQKRIELEKSGSNRADN